MKWRLGGKGRLRVTLTDRAEPLCLCAIAGAEPRGTALEWTAGSLDAREDAGANLVIRQAPHLAGVHRVGVPALGDVPGFIADSLPDAWGRLLVDRRVRQDGVDPRTLTSLDRLAIVGDRGPGALTFEPALDGAATEGQLLDLDALSDAAGLVLEGADSELLVRLERVGGSAGGTRPKAWIAEGPDGRLRAGACPLDTDEIGWLVKFRAPRADPEDIGRIEFAYALMAREAGLRVAEPRLFETSRGAYFGSRRFDRDGARRVHVLTAAAFLNVSHESAVAFDYVDLIKITRHITRSELEAQEAFRHAVFNVLAHNRDDHLKQFAFRREEGAWTRTPAYDLTMSDGPGGEHTILVGGEGRRPGREALLAVAEAGGLEGRGAQRIIAEVGDAIGRWPSIASNAGVGARSQRDIGERLREVSRWQ